MDASAAFDAKSIRSREVIAIREGLVVGRVHNLVFDPAEHRLLGLMVRRGHRGESRFLPAEAIRRLGPHAVTVDHDKSLEPIEAHPPAAEVLRSGTRIVGAPVMREDGDRIGTVRSIWMDASGAVERYEASRGALPFAHHIRVHPAEIIVVGPDAMVVRGEPEGWLAADGSR